MTAPFAWARRDVVQRWRDLLAVVLLTALCGGIVLAAVAGSRRAGAAVDRYLERSGDAEVIVFSSSPVEPRVVDALREDERVRAVLHTQLGIVQPAGTVPGRDIGVLAVPGDEAARTPWHPWLRAGRLPAPGATDEVAVSEATARRYDLSVGDRLPLAGVRTEDLAGCVAGNAAECPQIPAGEVDVTGIFRNVVDLGGEPDDQGMLLGDQAMLDARPEIARAHLLFAWTTDRALVDDVVDDYAVRVPAGDVTAGDDTLPGVRRATEVQAAALLAAAVVVGIAALAVIGPAYARYLAARRPAVEVLRALGMPRGGRFRAGVLPGLAAAIPAALATVAVAVAVSPALPLGVARRADPGVGIHADAAVLGLGFVGVTLLAALLFAGAAWRWSDWRPDAETTRDLAAGARLAGLATVSPAARVGTGLALDPGQGRRRLPVLPVLLATSAGIGLVVAALVVSASLTGLLQTSARYGAPWDLQVAPPDPNDVEAILERALDLDAVDGVATATYGELRLRTEAGAETEIGAVGVTTRRGAVAPTVLKGRPIGAADQVLVATTTARRLALEPGERLVLTGPRGLASAEVAGITILPPIGAATVDDGLVVPQELFDRLGAVELVDPIDRQAVLLVDTAAGSRDDVADALGTPGVGVVRPKPSPQAWSLRDVRPVARLLGLVTGVLAALAAFHALAAAVRRRRRDLGVLRGLGFTTRQAAGAIRWQAFTIGAVTALVGIPLGIVAGRVVWRAVAARVRVLDVVDVPLDRLALFALALLAGSVGLAVLPARRAARLRPADVLHDE